MGKGQLTVFVIVGIVVMFIFGILFMLRPPVRSSTDVHIAEFQRNVQTYVTSCLQLAGSDAVVKIGQQGGDLYDIVCEDTTCADLDKLHWIERTAAIMPIGTAVGIDFLPYLCDGAVCLVSYGIMKNHAPPMTFGPLDGSYPASDFDFSVPTNLRYFGDNSLRKLCDWDGPNAQDETRKITRPCDPEMYDSFYPVYLKNFSMQEQLDFFITSKLKSCVMLDSYVQKGYDFTVGEPNVTVIFGTGEVSLQAEYPIYAGIMKNSSNGSATIQSLRFSTQIPVRLKRVVEYAYELVEADISDIDFALPVDAAGAPTPQNNFSIPGLGYDPAFRFKKIKRACASCTTPMWMVDGNTALCPLEGCNPSFDSIIEITDTASMVNGRPFVFQFAVQNRRPVLDMVRDGDGVAVGLSVSPQVCSPYSFKILAKDPDDEDVLRIFVNSSTGTEWDEYLQWDCADASGTPIFTELECRSLELDANWNPGMWPLSAVINKFSYDSVAHPVLIDVQSPFSYRPFVDVLPVTFSVPTDARNHMRGVKDITAFALDEEGLMDVQSMDYQCCQPSSYTDACYAGLLKNVLP